MGNKFEEQFRNHAIHTSITKLESLLADSMLLEGATPFLPDLQRIQKVTVLIHEKLKSADPELIPVSVLDSLDSPIVNTLAHIENFLSNPSDQSIKNAIAYLDQAISLIPIFSSISVSQKSLQYLSLSNAQLDSFMHSLARKTNDFEKTLEELANEYSTINSIANSSKSTSDTTIKRSNYLIDSLQAQSQNIISDLQNQNQTIISSIQQQFSEAQGNRSSTFDTFISDYKTKSDSELDKLLDSHNNKIEEHFTKYNQNIGSMITDSEAKHARILELYHIVAGDSVGGDYANTAQKELETATFLRFWGVICLIVGILWVGTCIGITMFNGATWGEKEIKVAFNISAYHAIPAATITFIILSIAAYLLFQSEKHRGVSLWARQVNLELKAFEPFIHSIENENVKIELRKALTSKLFGHIKNPQNTKLKTETGLPIEKVIELLDKLPEAFKNKILS